MWIHWIFLLHMQLIWLHSAYQFKVLLHLLLFGGLGSFSGIGFAPIESPPMTSQYLSIQSFALSAAVWSQFPCPVMAPNSTSLPVWGLRVNLGGSEMVPIAITSPHSYSTAQNEANYMDLLFNNMVQQTSWLVNLHVYFRREDTPVWSCFCCLTKLKLLERY